MLEQPLANLVTWIVCFTQIDRPILRHTIQKLEDAALPSDFEGIRGLSHIG